MALPLPPFVNPCPTSQPSPDRPRSPRRLRPALWLSLGFLQLGCQALPSLLSDSATPVTLYRNDRFAFEFPRPQTWTEAPASGNGDGQAFLHPEDPSIEIRGWASFRPTDPAPTSTPNQPVSRFQAPSNGTPLWDCTTVNCAAIGGAPLGPNPTRSPNTPTQPGPTIPDVAFTVAANPPSDPVFEPNFVTQSGHMGELTVDIGFETSTVHLYLEVADREFHWQGTSPSDEFASYYPLFYSLAKGFQPLEPTPEEVARNPATAGQ